jgi:hypothetical protein
MNSLASKKKTKQAETMRHYRGVKAETRVSACKNMTACPLVAAIYRRVGGTGVMTLKAP